MYNFPVTCTYYEKSGDSTVNTVQFYVKAVSKNDAWLNAVQKIWTLLSSSSGEIITVTVYAGETEM